MNDPLASRAGSALFWRIAQQGGVNLLFFIRLLVLARVLAPLEIGLVAIAMTGVALFAALTDFGLHAALVQKEELTDRDYATAWTLGLLRGVTISAGLFLTAPLVAGAFGEPRAAEILRALAVLPLVDAATSARVVELTRSLRFRSLAFAKLGDALTNTSVCIVLAPLVGVWALVLGTLVGTSIHVVISYVVAPSRPRLLIDRAAANALLGYGKWIFVTGLVTIGAAALLRGLISNQLGTAALGMYFVAAKLAFLPNELASQVVGAVSFPVYAHVQSNHAQVRRAFQAIFTSTYVVLAPAFVLLIVLAPSIVDTVLGDKWAGSDSLIRILALAGMIGLLGDTAVPVLKGLGQPGRFALLEGGQSVLLLAAAWLLVDAFGLLGVALAWSAGVGATAALSVFLLTKTLGNPFAGSLRRLGAIGVTAIAGAAIAGYVQHAFPGWQGLLLAVAVAGVHAATLLLVLNRVLVLNLTSDLLLAFPQAAPLLAKYSTVK